MWAKKIRKQLKYFGSWREDPTGEKALAKFNREWPYLKDGRTPPPENISTDGCTVHELCNDFLASKEEKLNAGELSPRTFRDYFKTCEGMVDHFGKSRRVDDLRPDDFRSFRAKLAKKRGVVTLKNEINRVCIVLNYAFEQDLIDKPVKLGQSFDRPSAKAIRQNRNAAGPKLFHREELLRILETADVHLRAMVYLGLNGGFGNTDVASLPRTAVDLEHGWIFFPRPKTEIPQRVPLWPETIEALRDSFAKRPQPADPADDGLCFLTRQGRPWVRVTPKRSLPLDEATGEPKKPESADLVPIDAVSGQFTKILKALEIKGKGLGFYTLRHCFETIAGESKDQVAVDSIMGHVDPSMSANYRHAFSDERLFAVVNTVRNWLFPPEETEADGQGPEGGAE